MNTLRQIVGAIIVLFHMTSNTIEHYSEFSFVLKPSPLGGIGVFATHDIPVGTKIFNHSYALRILNIKDIPQEFIKYCIYISEEECICPEQFDRMEIGWYINHSNTPNIAAEPLALGIDNLVNDHAPYTIKDIKAGDEILIDYNYLNEPEELKEEYYH